MSIPIKKRARKPEQKSVRRQSILDGAFVLWKAKGFQQFIMNDLARKVGLAKGTLYLYFTTKEQLFLAMLEDRLNGFWHRVEKALAEIRLNDRRAAAEAFARSLYQDPDVLPLLLLLEPVLEHNIDLQSVLEFRRRLVRSMTRVAARIETCIPELSGRGLQTLLRMRAYMAGVQQAVSSPDSVATASLADDELRLLRMDMEREMTEGLALLLGVSSSDSLRGMQTAPRPEPLPESSPAGKSKDGVESSPWQRRF